MPRPGLPHGVLGMSRRGPDWARWVEGLPRLRSELMEQWGLRADGWMKHGYCALLVPVLREDGAPAMLKVHFPDEGSEHEHLALRHWSGRGAVRLQRADPSRRAMLLDRLEDRDLRALGDDVAACEVLAGLYADLHVPAYPQLRRLSRVAAGWEELLARVPRSAPVPHRMVEQARSLLRDLAVDPATDGVVVHTDLHPENVLAAPDGRWLAIDPRPLSGDPHVEPEPALRHDLVVGEPGVDVRAVVRERFHTLVDRARLDEARARDWVVVRAVVGAVLRLVEPGRHREVDDRTWVTTCVTVAKAVQD